MGHIKAGLFISLDGVIEAPETWHFPYFNDEMGAAVGELMSGNDAMLLGRQTYDEFAAYWPDADPADPMTAAMNHSRKYVVSGSLTEVAWENSTVVGGDVAAELGWTPSPDRSTPDIADSCMYCPIAAWVSGDGGTPSSMSWVW